MCQTVIDWPFILTCDLAYPCWISRLIDSVKVATTIYDTLYHSASLRISRYPGILCGEVLHWWLCALAEYLFRLSIRDSNKHFWRRCRGSNWLKLPYNWVTNFTVLSPLVLAGLPLLSLSFIRCRAVVAKMASHAIFPYNVLVIDIDNTTLGLIWLLRWPFLGF